MIRELFIKHGLCPEDLPKAGQVRVLCKRQSYGKRRKRADAATTDGVLRADREPLAN